MKIKVVLDMDSCTVSHVDKNDLNQEWVNIFKEKGLFIQAAGYPHILHPGAVELVQLLDSLSYFEILFFSSSYLKERNIELAHQLYKKALGEKRYAEDKDHIIVGSYDQIRYISGDENEIIDKKYNIYGRYKKDLEHFDNAFNLKLDLNWTALVEDDITYAFQPKNILKIPSGTASHYSDYYLNNVKRYEFEYYEDRMNNIFYAAGFLFTALNLIQHTNNTITLADALFKMQFKEKIDDPNLTNDSDEPFAPSYWARKTLKLVGGDRSKLSKETSILLADELSTKMESERQYAYTQENYLSKKEYFQRGLYYLQQVNPPLNFISRDNFLKDYKINSDYQSWQINQQSSHTNVYSGTLFAQPESNNWKNLTQLKPDNLSPRVLRMSLS